MFVYKQVEGGVRSFLNSLVDSIGDGRLWNTPESKVTSVFVGRLPVDPRIFRLPTDEFFIIIFTGNITFSSIPNLKGILKLFVSWGIRLAPSQITEVFNICSFLIPPNPQYVERSEVLINTQGATLDLNSKFSSPINEELVYSISPSIPITFLSESIIQFNYTRSGRRIIPIKVNQESFELRAKIDTDKNTLFLSLLASKIPYKALFTNDDSTITPDFWQEYSLTLPQRLVFEGMVTRKLHPTYFNSLGIYFGLEGQNHLRFNQSFRARSVLLVVYLEEVGNFSCWFGSKIIPLAIFRDTVLEEDLVIDELVSIGNNGVFVSASTLLVPGFNTILLTYSEEVFVDSFSKDRFIEDRGIRGSIFTILLFDEIIDQNTYKKLHTIISDYYDRAREILLLRFEGDLFNEAGFLLDEVRQAYSVNSKFGNKALLLNNSFFSLNNELLAFRYEDFTIRFWINGFSSVPLRVLELTGFLRVEVNQNNLIVSVLNKETFRVQLLPNYQFIVLSRKNNYLRIFINKVKFYEQESFLDFTRRELLVGNGLNTPNEVLLDELVVLRRVGLETVEDNSPYVPI
ncbi:MAG: hypothetical protein CV045_02925 [Cyanobacteria bacterium M5B4]|nr:MAG: hypothetical protein CV045_02925 [Cyanobacteria bacterium M5B4]